MKKVKFLALSALLLSTFTFQSCKDDDDNNNVAPEITSEKKVFILNEGSWQGNNSTMDLYYPNGENTYQSNVYASVNGEGIGDTGQDIIYYENRIYLSVWGSNYIAKLDDSGKVLEKHTFTAEEGQPRYLAAKDGFVYVSTYGDKIVKFDTTSIAASKGFVEVGYCPEDIAIKDNYLIVCNSVKDYTIPDNRISVVDLSTFTLKKHIESEYNNFLTIAVAGNNVYVTHYTPEYLIETLSVDIEAGTVKTATAASKLATYDDNLFCINTVADYSTNPYTYVTNYFKFGTTDSFLDLTETPELATANVYMFDINPYTGDFYIGTSDSKTNGTVYRFDKSGKFVTKFETSGINPNHAVFTR